MKYNIVIASSPDYEKAVVEIWINDQLIAELNNDNNLVQILFFSTEPNMFLEFCSFLKILEEAKQRLA